MTKAFGYLRTSSATNVGADKDSHKRQMAAIEAYAASADVEIVEWFYDADVRGADHVTERAGFCAMLEAIAGNGVCTIICESPDRFARDLIVQLTGHDHLKSLGIALIPASCPTHFLEETPTAVLIRQVLGAVAQFEKSSLVAKLKAARDRKALETGKCGGRKSHAEINPELVLRVKAMAEQHMSLRTISEVLALDGIKNINGEPFSPSSIKSMIDRR